MDVEGKSTGSSPVPLHSKLHLGDGEICFFEVNFPQDRDGYIVRLESRDLSHLMDLFDSEEFVFCGNAMSEDIMMAKEAISLVQGKPWTMAGNFLDTAVLWVSQAKCSKESYGIQTMLYNTLGGIQLKHWTLSCTKDWTKPWTSLHNNHTICNIGDQWAIIGPLKMLLILLLPTLFPTKDEVLQKTGLDELEFTEFSLPLS